MEIVIWFRNTEPGRKGLGTETSQHNEPLLL